MIGRLVIEPVRAEDASTLRAVIERPEPEAVLKDDGPTEVLRIRLDDGRAVIVKHNRNRGVLYALRHGGLPSRARRCLRAAARLTEAGIRTPVSVGMAERRSGGVVVESWFVHEYVPGETLDVVAPALGPSSRLAAIADQVAAIWQALGQLRMIHDDLKAQNFVVDDRDDVWLIDLDGARLRLPSARFASARRADLISHFKSWRRHAEISKVFECAFIDAAPELAPAIRKLRARGLA